MSSFKRNHQYVSRNHIISIKFITHHSNTDGGGTKEQHLQTDIEKKENGK